jgi:hypothetical protein
MGYDHDFEVLQLPPALHPDEDLPRIGFKGEFRVQCHNPDGTLAWEEVFPNGTCNSGITDNLTTYFASGTPITTWYLGLIDNAGFTALAVGDTMASHGGWAESVAYSQTVRQTWSPTVTGQSITNNTAATFTSNATPTIKGAFLCSSNVKGGTTGILWATGAFGSTQTLTNGQVLSVTYTCTGTGS